MPSGEKSGRRLLWSTSLWFLTLLSGNRASTYHGTHGLCWTAFGQVVAPVVQICTSGACPHQNPVAADKSRPWAIQSTRVQYHDLKAVYNNSTQLTIAQFTGWRRRRKKHSRNEKKQMTAWQPSLSILMLMEPQGPCCFSVPRAEAMKCAPCTPVCQPSMGVHRVQICNATIRYEMLF